MSRPTLGDERTNWRLVAVGVCIGAVLAVAPFAVVALMALAGIWMGAW